MTMQHGLETFQTMGEISRTISKQKEIKMNTNYQRVFAVNGIKRILAGLGLAAGVMLTQTVMAAGPATVNLRSTAHFTILAETQVTYPGAGTINGDVGLSPAAGTFLFIPQSQVIGTIYVVSAGGVSLASQVVDPTLLTAAIGDMMTAYTDAAGRTLPTATYATPGEIGGLNLAPGLYKFNTTALISTDLTLTGGADDVWIFQIGTILTLGSGIKVTLAGGARAGNIFWQVGENAVLGTYSTFKGTIMAGTSITMDEGSTMEGRALAQAQVTFQGSSGSLPTTESPGWLAIDVTPNNGSWLLTVPAGYTGPTTGTGDLAAVSATVGTYKIAYGALSGYLLPTNHNQTKFVVVGVTSLFTGVYRQASTNIAPPVLTATEGDYTNKVRISWPSVPGIISYEIWRSSTNDINTAAQITEVLDNGSGTSQCDDYAVVPARSYYYWGLSKTATLVSSMSLAELGYASPSDPNAPRADITASDMVYLPVNATNLTTAGTVSFWLGNIGPATLNTNNVAFDFRMGSNNTAMVLLGSAQRAFSLAAGQEQLVILTAQEKRNLVVPVTLRGVKQVQVTVRHASTALIDPNLANNKTTAAGMVLVRAAGVNSPARSLNDYDGDGKSDPALWHAGSNLWALCLSGQRYQSISELCTGNLGDLPVPGDYDGDGVTDMAIYCHLNGWWNVQFSSDERIIKEYFIGGPDYTAAQCDFDGDAVTDPVVYRTDGAWSGKASSRAYATCYSSLGGIGYEPVIEDYDGDGLADPAVYNRTTGLWQISFSGRDYQISTGTFGGSDYLPVSADYDGDGLVDPAIYAPGTAYWQVLLSASLATQGGYTWCDAFLGSVGGIPVPADYDGDGLADPAVYHQDTGLWELFRSTQDYALSWGFFGSPAYTPVTE